VTLENDIRIGTTQAKNQDWANLGYYEQKNKQLTKPSENGKRIVFIGDSITEEWGHLYPEFFSNNRYINRGIGGQTTPQILIRFKPDAIDLKPDVINIFAGTNDIAGNTGLSTVNMITNNIFTMAEVAMMRNIKVIISSILPAKIYPWNEDITDAPTKINFVNELIKEFVENNNLFHIDYFSHMVDENKGLKSEYTNDGVHPNEAGYKLMSGIAEKIVLQATG
jgi:lysophospholipase L1-like esterase|tara:strand:+ start:1855 stop:2523 length:669 start_codon:yes stop_codon:yes gene_type:complete